MSEPIENLLRQMPLRTPPPSLDARVLALRPAGESVSRKVSVPFRQYRRMQILGFLGGALAAAAALLLAWGLWFSGPAGSTPPAGESSAVANAGADPDLDARPVRLERNWSQLSYDGLVFPDEQTPWRKFRQQHLEHVRWIDPQRGVRMESTVPRENVILVKAPVY